MNIFILDRDPVLAAQYQFDKHVVKMPLETAQILCTVLHQYSRSPRYKPTHVHHPCTKWATGLMPFIWLTQHGMALCEEYTRRYGKIHKCAEVIEECGTLFGKFLMEDHDIDITQILLSGDYGLDNAALAMPDECKSNDVVDSYHRYYRYKLSKKPHLGKWTNREKPEWVL